MAPKLRIEVRAGQSDRAVVELTPGEPVEAFSVGTAASWVVAAPGVAEEHAYLYYDGSTLFVASAGASVVVSGRALPTDWTPAEVPSNLHLGGAKLAIRVERPGRAQPTSQTHAPVVATPRGHVMPDDEETAVGNPDLVHEQPTAIGSIPYVYEDVARTEVAAPQHSPFMQAAPNPAAPDPAPAASRPQRPPGAIAHNDREERTQIMSPEQHQPVKPARPAGLNLAAPESERTRVAPADATHRPAYTPPPVSRDEEARTVMKPIEEMLPRGSAGSAQPSIQVQDYPMQPQAGQSVPWRALPAGNPYDPTMPPGSLQPPAPNFQPPGVPQTQGVPPGLPRAAPATPSPIDDVKAMALKNWREASLPQKAILILMPFAFVAVFITFGGDEQAEETSPSTSASAVVSAAPSAAPPASATSALALATSAGDAAADAGAVQKLAEGEKTLEREAVDAVASGEFAKAAQLYEQLAKEQPKNPAFRQAADLMRKRAGGR